MKHYRQLTWRYLQGQRRRTILTLAGIILSVALITAIGSMMVSFRDFEIRQAVQETGDYHIHYSQIQGNMVTKIRNSDGVNLAAVISKEGDALVAPVSDLERAAGEDIPPYRYVKLKSYDDNAFKAFNMPLQEGRLPNKPGEIVLDYWVLEYFPGHPQVGDTITVDVGIRLDPDSGLPMDAFSWSGSEVFSKQTTQKYTIVGLTKTRVETSRNYLSNGITWLDGKSLPPDSSCDVYVKMNSPRGIKTKAESIAAALDMEKLTDANGVSNYPIEYNDKVLRLSAQSSDSILNRGMIMVVAFITLLVMLSTSAVIYNSFNISVLERISQFGTLRCIGAGPEQIRRIVLQEAGLMSSIGIPLGLLSGLLAVKVVLYGINLIDNNALVIMKDLKVIISPLVLTGSALLGLITVFLSARGPALAASRTSPLEAIRNTGCYSKEDFSKVRRYRWVELLTCFEGRLAFKNLRRNRKRFRITVFSMVISIVLYIVFGSFVNYLFFIGAVNRGADADYVLSIREGEARSFTEQHYQEITNLPGVARVYKNMNTEMVLETNRGRIDPRMAELKPDLLQDGPSGMVRFPVQLAFYGEQSLPRLEQELALGSLEEMNRDNGVVMIATSRIYDPDIKRMVIVNSLNYQIGDHIRITKEDSTGKSQYTDLKIMGIADKSIIEDSYLQDGEVLLLTTDKVYKRITGNNEYSELAIKMESGHQGKAVLSYLKQLTAARPEFEYVDMAQVMEAMRNAALTLSIFLYGFVAVIALIGCLNIINTISTNLILRRRELAALEAIGVTKAGIKSLVSLEGLLYGIVAALYGSIIGTVLSYLLSLLFSQNIIEFTWSVPWKLIVSASLGALIIALLATYIPLHRISQDSIVENLRTTE